jgi:hypothetical protein
MGFDGAPLPDDFPGLRLIKVVGCESKGRAGARMNADTAEFFQHDHG